MSLTGFRFPVWRAIGSPGNGRTRFASLSVLLFERSGSGAAGKLLRNSAPVGRDGIGAIGRQEL